MSELKLKILDKYNCTKAASEHSTMTVLVHTASYEEGDLICLEAGKNGCFCVVQFDDAMLPALVYLSSNVMYFKIPFGEKRAALSPKAFQGVCHLLRAYIVDETELKTRRNLAINPYDGFCNEGIFPHAAANVETRDEAVFAARNAIDGIFANHSHGNFPYASWGINRKPDAEWRLEFGVEAKIDEIRLTLRADFPHDNYWTQVTIEFSDGSTEIFQLKKTAAPQHFSIESRCAKWLLLKNLVQSEDASPFPALTQLEVWGCY